LYRADVERIGCRPNCRSLGVAGDQPCGAGHERWGSIQSTGSAGSRASAEYVPGAFGSAAVSNNFAIAFGSAGVSNTFADADSANSGFECNATANHATANGFSEHSQRCQQRQGHREREPGASGYADQRRAAGITRCGHDEQPT
jgi:hypothetical protein